MKNIFVENRRIIKYILLLIAVLLTALVGWMFVMAFPIFLKVITMIVSIVLPFVVSFFIAYLLHPFIKYLENKFQIKRWIIILILYIVVIFGFGTLFLFVFFPAIRNGATNFINEIQNPDFIENAKNNLLSIFGDNSLKDTVEQYADEFLLKIRIAISTNSPNLISVLAAMLLSSVVNLLLIPIVSFYFLKDFEKILAFFKRVIIPKYRMTVVNLFSRIDNKIGSYLRSQILLMTIISILAMIGYKIIGLPYFYLFALFIGLTNVIPYIGAYIGAAPPIIYLIVSGGDLKLIFFVVGVNVLIQVIEGNFLQPYIMSKSLEYHPLVIILAMLLAGEFLGPLGIIFAVPSLIIIFETGRYIYEKNIMKYYLESDSEYESFIHDEEDFAEFETADFKNGQKKTLLPKRSSK